jgi:Zn-dependent protease
MSFRNFVDKLKRYFAFSKEEWTAFCISVLSLAFIYNWDKWGIRGFDLAYGLKNYLIAIVFIAITVFVHHAGQRILALQLGLRAEQRLWWYGFLIGLILVIVSNGNIKFLAATSTIAYMLPAHRLGAFRYGPNVGTIAKIVLAGPLLNIFFSALIKTMEWAGMLSPSVSEPLFVLNLVYAGWNLLPIPPLDGSKIFYYSRLTYAFLFGSIVSYVIMVYVFNIYSYIWALFFGCIFWLAFYTFFEKEYRGF